MERERGRERRREGGRRREGEREGEEGHWVLFMNFLCFLPAALTEPVYSWEMLYPGPLLYLVHFTSSC